MAKKRSAELAREIKETLAKIPRKSLKTRNELDVEIDSYLAQGSKAERFEIASALGYRYPKRPTPKESLMTPLNVSVLAQIAHGRQEFPNKVSAASAPHVRRCIKAGAVKPLGRDRLQITPFGHESIMDYMATYPTLTRWETPTGAYTDEVYD